MSQPKNVLNLAGIALADLLVHMSAGQYVPTLHTSKTTLWSGRKIEQLRFGSYPETGLLEIAWAEALVRAPHWDAWAFGFVAAREDNIAFVVEAGGAPLTNIVRILQESRPPKELFGLVGYPRFYARVQSSYEPVDATQAAQWRGLLEQGIDTLRAARAIWRGGSTEPHKS